jgi:hypothetical protein
MANMPLDTSITVQPPVHGNSGVAPFNHGEIGPLASREAGPPDQRPTSVFRPSTPYGVPNIPRNSLSPNSNPSVPGIGLKNASGARVQDRARAAMARTIARTGPVKNAIGSTVPGDAVANGTMPLGRPPANGAAVSNATTTLASRGDANGLSSGVTRNAIGVTANFRPRIPRANAETQAGTLAATDHAMPAGPIINGHGLARPMTGPAMIGGPAHRGGMLSGSDFHLRRP